MISILTDFNQQLEDVKKLIQFYEIEKKLSQVLEFNDSSNDIILGELSNKFKEFRLSKLKFNYNSIIISIYGSFERFIENVIVAYIENINNIFSDYKNLPEIITKHHLILSLTLLNKVEQPKYNGPLSKEIIIKNLHTCINTVDSYQLNKEAFAQHSANFRTQVIDESFNQIGIKDLSARILKTNIFKKYLIDFKGFDAESSEFYLIENLEILNNLAELRNFVAHGIDNEILDNSILMEYIDFFKSYSQALLEVCQENLLDFEISNNGIKLGEITDVFKDGEVVCFKTNKVIVKKGDKLIGKNSYTIKSSLIKNIKIDDTDKEESDIETEEIGVQLDQKFKKNFELYLVKDVT